MITDKKEKWRSTRSRERKRKVLTEPRAGRWMQTEVHTDESTAWGDTTGKSNEAKDDVVAGWIDVFTRGVGKTNDDPAA